MAEHLKSSWTWSALIAALALLAALLLVAACEGDDDDDDDDDWSQYPATLSGTLYYDGERVGAQIMVAITDEWPMTGAPLYFTYLDFPADGFPSSYKVGLDRTGELYVLALIDVDPDDGVGMNPDIDPLALPSAVLSVQPGDNAYDFTFLDPEDIADDDDDDDDAVDDDDDDVTGLKGVLVYDGTATGANVVIGLWDTPLPFPMSAPDHSYKIAVPGTGFPFEYRIEDEVPGTWRTAAFLDVDPNDGDSMADIDPRDMTFSQTTITSGSMATRDYLLVDP